MKIVKQSVQLPVKNVSMIEENADSRRRKHGQLFPNSIRCIICGPSGCGKTNLILTLLTHPNGLKFANIYVYSKSLYQDKYRQLAAILKLVPRVGFFQFDSNTEVIDPNEAEPYSVFVFDDVACDKQDKIKAFFSMGRHRDVDCFYLCQTYTAIPKHLLRDNCNLIVLFRQDSVNLKHVYDEHVTTDCSFDEFKEMCKACWTDFGFVVIDKESTINRGRYRKGFDHFIVFDEKDVAGTR